MDTGRTTKQETVTKLTYPVPSLEAEFGFTIRKAPNGGGFLFYWISIDKNENEQLNPLDIVGESKAWIEETAQEYGLDLDLLKMSKVMAKATPKAEKEKQKTSTFEIITNKVSRISPDSGTIEGRPYIGLWLPAKVTDESGVSIKQIFHLLFRAST